MTERPPATAPGAPGRRGVGGDSSIRLWTGDGSVSPEEAARACRRRALLLWPSLDASRLARTRGDPWRIARLVAERTSRSLDEIVGILTTATPACPVPAVRPRRP